MKRLRVKLCSELFYARFFHEIRPRRESLADVQVVQIQLFFTLGRLLCFTHGVVDTSLIGSLSSCPPAF